MIVRYMKIFHKRKKALKMAIRIASVDKSTFFTCIKHNLWGANNGSVDKWNIGDTLIFKVNNSLKAVARIVDKPYVDDTPIWENGLFWNRVPLEFDNILNDENSITFSGEIRDMFLREWGINYGWVILNKYPLKDDIAGSILKQFETKENNISYYKENIDKIIKSAV